MVVRTSHIVLAVVLHVLVLGMLFVGFRCSKKVTPPPVIQATIVGTPTPAKPEPPKEDPNKLEEEKRKAEEKQKAEEKKKSEQQAKLKAQEEAKKKAAEDLKKKKEETERKIKEDKSKQETEKKKQQKELESQLNQQMKQEESQRNSAARASAQQIWMGQIKAKIEDKWLQPPGMAEDVNCWVRIKLLPGGQVVGVTLQGTCGNAVLDDSVKRAVLKSDPLPIPEDRSVFDPEINFNFCPSCK